MRQFGELGIEQRFLFASFGTAHADPIAVEPKIRTARHSRTAPSSTSRSNRRRLARSDSLAAFAAVAGETASSASSISITRPAPLPSALARRSTASPIAAKDRRRAHEPPARRARTAVAQWSGQSASPGRGRRPADRDDGRAIVVASRAMGASQPSFRASIRSLSHSAKISVSARGAPSSIRVVVELGARRRRQRIFFALKETSAAPRPALRDPGLAAVRADRRPCASVGSSNRDRRRGETAPQPMDAPGGAGGRVPAGVGRDARRRAARKILAMARQGGAGGRGAQGQALAQRAGERRIGAKNLVQQSEAGAGEESRLEPASAPTPARFGGRAQDGNACFNSGLAGAKLQRGAPARPPPRQGDGRRAARSAAGVSSSRTSAGSNRTMASA